MDKVTTLDEVREAVTALSDIQKDIDRIAHELAGYINLHGESDEEKKWLNEEVDTHIDALADVIRDIAASRCGIDSLTANHRSDN